MKSILSYSRSRPDLWTLAFILLTLIYILPIWILKYFPSQDGPSHIYNCFILKHYSDPDYVFNQFYEIRKSPIPNWTCHAFITFFMYLVPPLIAEKLLLTGYIVLMAVGMLYLLNAVEDRRKPLVLIGFPFIYNYILLMGFYNFSLGIGMLMLVIGYWWKHSDTFGVRNAIVLGLLLVALYFCHLVPLALAIFSIAVITLVCLPFRFARWKQTLFTFLCMLPAAGLTIYYTSTRGTERSGVWELSRLWQYFIRNESLAYHSESQIIFGKMVTGAFVVLFFYTLIRDHFFTNEWRFGLRLHRKDFFLLLCAAFFIMYLKAPDSMSGGGFIKTRMSLFPFLIIIPWLSWDMPRVARGVVGVVLIVLATAYIAHVSYYHKIINDDIEVYNSGYDAVERNKVLLPLGIDYEGRSWRIGIYTHTPGYYGYERGIINLINYEAGTDYFPTVFKPDFHRPTIAQVHVKHTEIDFAEYLDDIDYVLTWALITGSELEVRILRYYELVKHNENLKIFRRIE
ncbi:hypothetical protein ACFL6S_26025 [Candidatus Poribacteria bacterium]